MLQGRELGRTGLSGTRLGLGLAALGRPGYINLGRDEDLPAQRTVDALQAQTFAMLDAAYESGIRYFDAARSYGRAEAFLKAWLDERRMEPGDVVVASKWGYAYTADWKVDAPTHEVKEHSVQQLLRQWAVSSGLFWSSLDIYQVHSATLDSGILDDGELHAALGDLKDRFGVTMGLSVSGPRQGETLARAMEIVIDGRRLFDVVQATWNPLEPSVGHALAAAYSEQMAVVIKESVANGRLTDRGLATLSPAAAERVRGACRRHEVSVDTWAMAAALAQPWADVVLSGAVTTNQLASNLRALSLAWGPEDEADLAAIAESAEGYWTYRKSLQWT